MLVICTVRGLTYLPTCASTAPRANFRHLSCFPLPLYKLPSTRINTTSSYIVQYFVVAVLFWECPCPNCWAVSVCCVLLTVQAPCYDSGAVPTSAGLQGVSNTSPARGRPVANVLAVPLPRVRVYR